MTFALADSSEEDYVFAGLKKFVGNVLCVL